MTSTILERGKLTDAFVIALAGNSVLSGANILVGDGEAPPAAGWVNGEPGNGPFTCSVTVSTGEATPNFKDPVNSRHSSWTAYYSLRIIGSSRQQTDDAGDLVRAAALTFIHHTLTIPYKVLEVVYPRLGPVVRNTTDPDNVLWEITDLVALQVERKRA